MRDLQVLQPRNRVTTVQSTDSPGLFETVAAPINYRGTQFQPPGLRLLVSSRRFWHNPVTASPNLRLKHPIPGRDIHC